MKHTSVMKRICQVNLALVVAFDPSVQMPRRGNMIRLGRVAFFVGEDEVVAKVQRVSRPRHKMVDMSPASDERLTAVEAAAVRKLGQDRQQFAQVRSITAKLELVKSTIVRPLVCEHDWLEWGVLQKSAVRCPSEGKWCDMPENKPCPLCSTPAMQSFGAGVMVAVECRVCGPYEIHRIPLVVAQNGTPVENAHLLSGYTREHTEENAMSDEPSLPSIDRDCQIEGTTVNYPAGIADKAAKVLAAIGRRAEYYGQTVTLQPVTDYPLGYARNAEEFSHILDYLRDDDRITRTNTSEGSAVALTPKGTLELESLHIPQTAEGRADTATEEGLEESEVSLDSTSELELIPGDLSPKVFISYRRKDSPYAAQAIYDKLVAHYGANSVVFDVDTIPLGVDFVAYLNDQVGQCDALLAIIGDNWIEARKDDGTRRLDDPDDFVRIEIEAALRRSIRVIPVLTGQVAMPRKDDLPRGMKALADRHAAEVRTGHDLPHHLERLVRGMDHSFKYAFRVAPEVKSSAFGVHLHGGVFTDERGIVGISFKATNTGTDAIPPYELTIFHPGPPPNRRAILPSRTQGGLLPEQRREHRCYVFQQPGAPPAVNFFQDEECDPELFSMQLVLEHSDKVLYENKRLGRDFVEVY